eukprot:TRINITY_DN59255_c0_g1_i2.p1 TRINITY_DN59255_c0_g1~~TRINITY_DN59255_c0_g1_i2.p1  ORF type:complete len:602 (-),score=41.18 TRINITY_DN59255_c0_g1_i2:124-1929(-)
MDVVPVVWPPLPGLVRNRAWKDVVAQRFQPPEVTHNTIYYTPALPKKQLSHFYPLLQSYLLQEADITLHNITFAISGNSSPRTAYDKAAKLVLERALLVLCQDLCSRLNIYGWWRNALVPTPTGEDVNTSERNIQQTAANMCKVLTAAADDLCATLSNQEKQEFQQYERLLQDQVAEQKGNWTTFATNQPSIELLQQPATDCVVSQTVVSAPNQPNQQVPVLVQGSVHEATEPAPTTASTSALSRCLDELEQETAKGACITPAFMQKHCLEAYLGGGAEATVWKAGSYAVRVSEKPFRSDLLKEMLHPNLMQYTLCEQEPNSWIREPSAAFCHIGKDLTKFEVPWDEAHAAVVFLSVLRALAFLHAKQPPIQHGDVKPANILLVETQSGDQVVQLNDFGATMQRSSTEHLQQQQQSNIDYKMLMQGTECFREPELLADVSTRWHDIWALGLTMGILGGAITEADLENYTEGGLPFVGCVSSKLDHWPNLRPWVLDCVRPHQSGTYHSSQYRAAALLERWYTTNPIAIKEVSCEDLDGGSKNTTTTTTTSSSSSHSTSITSGQGYWYRCEKCTRLTRLLQPQPPPVHNHLCGGQLVCCDAPY